MKTKQIAAIIFSVGIFLIGCMQSPLENLVPVQKPGKGINILIADTFLFSNDDIEYYDQSAHLFYLNRNLNYSIENYYEASFWITNEDDVLLSGIYSYYCSCFYLYYREPETQLVHTGKCGAPYLLMLDFKYSYDSLYFANNDNRKDPDFLNALLANGKLRNGLVGEFDELDLISSKEISLTVKVTNHDSINYYFPDPEKMPIELYHGFTGGLILVDSTNITCDGNIKKVSLASFTDFNSDWFTLVKSGESVYFTITYSNFDPLIGGSYNAFFKLPGIWGIVPDKEDLTLADGQIWLGFSDLRMKVEL